MKVQIIKKGVSKAKPAGYCSAVVDDFPMNKK